MDQGRPLVVVVRVVAADGTCRRSLRLRWAVCPPAVDVVEELCLRMLQARRDGCRLVVVEPAEVVLLLAACGLST